ncbi:hypothetical protein MKW98_019084 [Papaver atlanticum]|uniref:FBD domain-containing protein n=1 Tax=Papaver atlanticum TaxID=357466 RepID=A0AAD4TGD5_9MAGN|nr:hypothetical protein MKW98_019084 [Papaver atlanticum]
MLVKFAMRSNCLTIDLEFCCQGTVFLIPEYDKMYTLPPCFFPHPSVSQLKLTSCKFIPSLYNNFTSVNIAKLASVELQKDSVYDLVSKCLCLEELHLIKCKISSPFSELNAPNTNLKSLVFQSSCLYPHSNSFEIEVPTSGYLSLHNSVNIIGAEIDIYNSPLYQHNLSKLLTNLQNVNSLTLFSKNLEDTEDEWLSAVYNEDEEAVRQLHLVLSECVAHLMKIKIMNFLGTKVEMEFVEHILRSSLCLKEMVICIRSRYDFPCFDIIKEHYKALKKKTIASFQACTRASPNAKILLE